MTFDKKNTYKLFMVFLLCKLFIPEYVTINIFIIGYHTLGSKSFKEEKIGNMGQNFEYEIQITQGAKN